MVRETRPNRPDLVALREGLGVQALTFLASQPEAIGRFLALTGIGPADLRQAARQPEFLCGVLDYLLSDEALLVAFAQSLDLPPEAVASAARQPPGGQGKSGRRRLPPL
ncbi:MAG: DUF3572 domain-containing protein [Bauldia sp.]